MKALKLLFIVSAAFLIAGCKLAIVVVEGGRVEGLNSPDCLVGTNCVVNVTDTDFSESFTAVPAPGWQFVKWNSGGNFFCANSVNPTCSLSLAGTAGNAAIEAFVASSKTFYIMPVFERLPGGLPITDTITVDGKQWAQPDLFRNLQWHDMNAVCPSGICNGILSGYEMAGWTWASVAQINTLFNYYIGSEQLGPDPDDHSPFPNGLFWGDGWRPLYDPTLYNDDMARIFAFSSTCSADGGGGFVAYLGIVGLMYNPSLTGIVGTNGGYSYYDQGCSAPANSNQPASFNFTGGWFYRTF